MDGTKRKKRKNKHKHNKIIILGENSKTGADVVIPKATMDMPKASVVDVPKAVVDVPKAVVDMPKASVVDVPKTAIDRQQTMRKPRKYNFINRALYAQKKDNTVSIFKRDPNAIDFTVSKLYGPTSATYFKSSMDTFGKKILILGEFHNSMKLPEIEEPQEISVAEYLLKLALYSPICVDIIIECSSELSTNLEFAAMKSDVYYTDAIIAFVDIIKQQQKRKSLQHINDIFPHARIHLLDIRKSFGITYFTSLAEENNASDAFYTIIQQINPAKFPNLFNISDKILDYLLLIDTSHSAEQALSSYIYNAHKILDEENTTTFDELIAKNDNFMEHYKQLISDIEPKLFEAIKLEDIKYVLKDTIKLVIEENYYDRPIQILLCECYSVIPMDLYTIITYFSKVGGDALKQCSPIMKNTVFYCGELHAIIYKYFFETFFGTDREFSVVGMDDDITFSTPFNFFEDVE